MHKKIKKIIIVLIIIAVIATTALLFLKQKNKKENTVEGISNEKIENSREYYYNVVSAFNKYFTYVKYLNAKIEDLRIVITDDNEEEILNAYKNDGMTAILGMIDKQYIQEIGATENKIYEDLKPFSQDDINIDKIEIENLSEEMYLAIIKGTAKKSLKDFDLIIKVDKQNNTYSIFLNDYMQKYGYDRNSDKIIDFKINKEIIEKNQFNTFVNQVISDRQQIIKYFNEYKQNALNYPQFAYNSLDENYRTAKFGTIDNYIKYLNTQTDFNTASIDRYALNKYDNFTQLYGIDQYGKEYLFNETETMQYTVMLDNYVTDSPEFVAKYDATNEQGKVTLNIEKFIKALNDKSYYYIYNSLLAESFKENYFSTLEDFEKYAQENFYEANIIERMDYEEGAFSETVGLYRYKLTFADTIITDEATPKDAVKRMTKTFIMKLNDNRKFEMSFNIN